MKKTLWIILFAFILILGSCKSDYDFGIEVNKHVIVNGIFEPDSTWNIQILKAPGSLWEYEFRPLINAMVNISVKGIKYPLVQKTNSSSSYYTSDSEKVPNEINQGFTLEIQNDDQLISATSYIPAIPDYIWEIEEYKVEKYDKDPSDQQFNLWVDITISLTFDFENDDNRYFNIKTRYRPQSMYAQIYTDSVVDVISTSVEYPTAFTSIRRTDGEFVNLRGQTNQTKIFVKIGGVLRNIKVDHSNIYFIVSSVTEDYYNYQKKIIDQVTASQDLFSEPVQIPGNIEGGLGIFSGIHSKMELIEIKPGVLK